MKFSFESQQYRDDLAQEVKDTEKSERKALLEQKKQTLEYALASHVRDFEKGAEKSGDRRKKEREVKREAELEYKPGMSYIEFARRLVKDAEQQALLKKKEEERSVLINNVERVTKQEVVVKTNDGKEHIIELEITDISDQIPDSVKIIYDMNRLLEVEGSINDPDIVRGWKKNDPDYEGRSYRNRDYRDQNLLIVQKYVKMTNTERGVPLLKADGSPIDEMELKRIAEQAAEDFKVFRSQITEGLSDSQHVFYHTIGAYTKWNGDNSTSASRSLPDKVIAESLNSRFPHQDIEGDVIEKPIELGQNLQSDQLWVHAGELVYDSMLKPLMLMDGNSERFRREVYGLRSLNTEKFVGFSKYDNLEDAIELANTRNEWGALMYFGESATPWLLVADQIFDPYHGRLIKIKEVDKSEEDLKK